LDDTIALNQFLRDYPGMSLTPIQGDVIVLKGIFSFLAKPKEGPELIDSYHLEITVPGTFPRTIPKVKELDGKIPNDGNHHINYDGTLCLGSPIRLLQILSKKPNLLGFAENCLVPYLYAMTNKLNNGGEFIFSELEHGRQGLITDYKVLFGLNKREQVLRTLILLGMKRRHANKFKCPCDCGKRFGQCNFHNKINIFRSLASRSWFRTHCIEVFDVKNMSKNYLKRYLKQFEHG